MGSEINLFCIPYAGSSASCYYAWNKWLPDEVILKPIALPGRGRRFKEPYYDTLEQAVDDIYTAIADDIVTTDYVLFGHSMGSTLAYELARGIIGKGYPGPKHIVFSGSLPPDIKRPEVCLNVPEDQFRSSIIKMGNIPPEALENEELADMLFKTTRADFEILERYRFRESPQKINCDISVFYGEEDTLTDYASMLGWSSHTTGKTQFYRFHGGHFFLHTDAAIISVLSSILHKHCFARDELILA